jgi:hypothetical protein
MESEERIRIAVTNTQIVRAPKQSLATFGVTNVYYYLVAEAAINDITRTSETVIREGRVIAERPRIVTPYYLSRIQGFSPEAKKYFEMLLNSLESSSPAFFMPTATNPGN